MILDILADDLRRDFISHRASKVSMLPEFTSPELVLKLRELPKEQPPDML